MSRLFTSIVTFGGQFHIPVLFSSCSPQLWSIHSSILLLLLPLLLIIVHLIIWSVTTTFVPSSRSSAPKYAVTYYASAPFRILDTFAMFAHFLFFFCVAFDSFYLGGSSSKAWSILFVNERMNGWKPLQTFPAQHLLRYRQPHLPLLLLCHTTKGCTRLWQPIKKLKHTNLNFTMHKNRNDKADKHTHNTMTTRGCQCQVPPKDLCRCGISALHRHCRSFSSYQRPSRGVINADLRTLIMIWFDQNGKSTETSSSWDCLGGKWKTRKLSVSEL